MPLMRKGEFCTIPQVHILTARKPISTWCRIPAEGRILVNKVRDRRDSHFYCYVTHAIFLEFSSDVWR